MLLELSVENIAIIDKAGISLGPGFTALTGETGAGKSLLVDAITLALGGRADSDLVRSGSSKGVVSLLIDVSTSPDVLTRCTELGVEVDAGQLAVQRELSAEGRSTVRLNGRPTSVGVLKEIGALLVDLHGQHDHQALLVQERQLEFLDSWIGDQVQISLSRVSQQFAETESLRRKLAHLQRSQQDRSQRTDMLEFQIQEIESVNPLVGEIAALQVQIERLQHLERLSEGANRSVNQMVGMEGSALELLGSIQKELQSLVTYDPSLEEIVASLSESTVRLQETSRDLAKYVDALQSEPGSLESVASRLDAVKKLMRKYGDTEEAVLEHLDRAKSELEALTGDETNVDELCSRLAAEEAKLNELAEDLTDLRTRMAKQFESEVQEHIRELAMENAGFQVQISRKPIDMLGQDEIVFLFSANLGEGLLPLSKVASGGEISRVMLAIKVAGAGKAGVGTLIFDEIDTGLSGRAAAVTANKLEQLAKSRQVVVISHLPQIAARADVHFRIEKSQDGQRTVTKVVELGHEERIHEIARMLAGESIGESALANARELVGK